jgi:hypothetical protein
MELIMMPLPLICYTTIIIKQPTISIHSIIFPLTLIVPSVFVVESTFTISLVVIDKATILASILVLQLSILPFWFVRRHFIKWLLLSWILLRNSPVILQLHRGIVVAYRGFGCLLNWPHFIIYIAFLDVLVWNRIIDYTLRACFITAQHDTLRLLSYLWIGYTWPFYWHNLWLHHLQIW